MTCISKIVICSVSFLVCLERSWRRQLFVKNNSLNQVDPKSEIDDLFSRATEHRNVSYRKYDKRNTCGMGFRACIVLEGIQSRHSQEVEALP